MRLFDMDMENRDRLPFLNRPVPQPLVLDLLNDAVWAPNHGLREPWRFIYIDDDSGNKMPVSHDPAPAHLIVVMKEDADAHKQDEDFAAVCCLVQNFQLLAWEKNLGARRSRKEWMYDRRSCSQLGVRERERIAAVLELGFIDRTTTLKPVAMETPTVRLNFTLL